MTAADRAAAERQAQGLPLTVQDVALLERAAMLLELEALTLELAA